MMQQLPLYFSRRTGSSRRRRNRFGVLRALKPAEMLTTRQPQEVFAAEDERDGYDWIVIFTNTRESAVYESQAEANATNAS